MIPVRRPEGLWCAGSRCGSVLVETVRVKSASRPFGIERVRLLTRTVSTREGRSYRDPAEGSGPEGHFGKVGVTRGNDGKVGRGAGWRWRGGSWCGGRWRGRSDLVAWGNGRSPGHQTARGRRLARRVGWVGGVFDGLAVGPGSPCIPNSAGKRLPRGVGVVRGSCACTGVRGCLRLRRDRCLGGDGAV